MTPLPDALWEPVNEALDERRSPWDDERVVDWLAEHPDDFAPLERTLARLHAAENARPRRASLAAAAGFALALLLPLAARSARTPTDAHADASGDISVRRPSALTVHALEIRVDRGRPRGTSSSSTAPFAHVDVRVETLRQLNPRR